ncbi:hypothetical protein GCM10022232_23900 [Streptomyces plumbiresistens]|uniref:Uncharacterized protein n=1 Tax=Streptomyces plumbiresistens TaxID=511811 RepID=A0ABP7QX79_9ACTN
MRSVGSGLELHSALDRNGETAAALTGARYAAIGVLAEDGEGLAGCGARLAVQFASQAGAALMTAEAPRDRERLAVYVDRDRITRDLQHLVIQRLFVTG